MVRDLAWIASWFTPSTFLMNATTAINTNVTAPIVDLGYARYQGYFDAQTNITNFLSIRYAAPPLGEYTIILPMVVPTVVVVLKYVIPRELEVSSTSATGCRVWCTTRDAEP